MKASVFVFRLAQPISYYPHFFTRGGNTQFLSNNLKLRRRVYAGNFQEALHKKS